MKNLIKQVREAVRATYASANQINGATEQLAVATQQQSVQAQEVANSVDEMAQTITDNARNATETATVSYNSGKAARDASSCESRRMTCQPQTHSHSVSHFPSIEPPS